MSPDPYELHRLRAVATNLIDACRSNKCRNGHLRAALARWLAEFAAEIGLSEAAADAVRRIGPDHSIDSKEWLRLAAERAALGEPTVAPAPSDLEQRLGWIAEALALTPLDTAILGLLVRGHVAPEFGRLFGSPENDPSLENKVRLILAWGLAQPIAAICARLEDGAALRVMGLAVDSGDGMMAGKPLLRVIEDPAADVETLRSALVGRPLKASLGWDDFGHLGEDRDLVLHLAEAALANSAPGVNILLHGAPGTGKTEFAKTLGERLDARVMFVGERDEYGDEPNRSERIAAFAAARVLAARAGRTIIVVDEADDVFHGLDELRTRGVSGSKVFINRLVESTPVPTVWITNHAQRLGAAVLRRMMVSLGFPQPGRAGRERMAQRILDRHAIAVSPPELARIAALNVPPAVVAQSARAASLVAGGAKAVERAAASVEKLLRGRPAPPFAASGALPFDPSLSSADTDLAALTDAIVRSGRTDVSLCLHGLPGTGKSAFARHLARHMGLDVLEKRASDLLGCYVGETEARIAETFQQAFAERLFLILDEADALLFDRRTASRSWERSQVDEMLVWMERHPTPFACTTNLLDTLDPATLRRFVFKIRFLPMTPAQAVEAFRRSFHHEPPRALAEIAPLTPGDFAAVSRRAAILAESQPVRLCAMLAEEVAVKPGVQRTKLGFLAA